MQALVTTPGREHSTRVEERPEPSGDGALVRVLEVGVCGTDREIDHGLFGDPPEEGRELVMGHEMLGVLARDGGGFSKGDLVSATVRRSCHHCIACEEGSPDSCLTGDYRERGITRLDGFARELVVEHPDEGAFARRRRPFLDSCRVRLAGRRDERLHVRRRSAHRRP